MQTPPHIKKELSKREGVYIGTLPVSGTDWVCWRKPSESQTLYDARCEKMRERFEAQLERQRVRVKLSAPQINRLNESTAHWHSTEDVTWRATYIEASAATALFLARYAAIEAQTDHASEVDVHGGSDAQALQTAELGGRTIQASWWTIAAKLFAAAGDRQNGLTCRWNASDVKRGRPTRPVED